MTDSYLIWSHFHFAWRGPDRCVLTRLLGQAGRYSHAEAIDICASAIPGMGLLAGALPELPVREADVMAMRDRFHDAFPDAENEDWE